MAGTLSILNKNSLLPASVYPYSRVRNKMKIAEISLWVEAGMQFFLPLGALFT